MKVGRSWVAHLIQDCGGNSFPISDCARAVILRRFPVVHVPGRREPLFLILPSRRGKLCAAPDSSVRGSGSGAAQTLPRRERNVSNNGPRLLETWAKSEPGGAVQIDLAAGSWYYNTTARGNQFMLFRSVIWDVDDRRRKR